jgi:hypothetical protein
MSDARGIRGVRRLGRILLVTGLAAGAAGCERTQVNEVTRVSCGETTLTIVETLVARPPAGYDVDFELFLGGGEHRRLVDRLRSEPAYPEPRPTEGYVRWQPDEKYSWHVHVSPSEFSGEEYSRIRACLGTNLEKIQADLSRSRKPHAQFHIRRQPAIVSIRHFDWESLRRTYDREDSDRRIEVDPSGEIVLVTPQRKTVIGLVEAEGSRVVLMEKSQSPDLEEGKVGELIKYFGGFANAEGRTLFHDFDVRSAAHEEFWRLKGGF